MSTHGDEAFGKRGDDTGRWRRWGERWSALPRALRALFVAALAGAGFFGVVWARCGIGGCPDVGRLSSYQPGRAPKVLDRHGRVFADLSPIPGAMVKLTSLPKHVPQAFIAVEDRRFYGHRGLDLIRVAGATLTNLRKGRFAEGFSTITMQLARNVFPERIRGRERTATRKLLEIRVAGDIEASFTKNEILELYLNHIYFGNGARGIEAAARHYFGVPARDMRLHQAALLAALVRGPSVYDPRRHPDAARERRNLILKLMHDQGHITAAQESASRSLPLGIARRRPPAGRVGMAPYFVEQVRKDLEEQLGESLYDEPLRVVTTLDAGAQQAAEEELIAQLRAIERATDDLQGALVAMHVETGDVLSWVGGRDFAQSRFDRVRSGRRQAGSAFKPFVYAAALASGHTLSEHLADAPLRVRLDRRTTWEPRNFDGTFEGTVTLRDALVRSKNVPTVRLANDVGLGAIGDLAHDSGIEAEIPETPAMPLGTVALSPLELATAYTPFASLGQGVVPRLVLRVERMDGDVAWRAPEPERKKVLDPAVAFLVTAALGEAVYRGTGTAVREAGFTGPAAGKTGTTNEGTDAWFVGYTPDVVAAVWIGFDQPRPIMPLATGGRLAAPVWGAFMRRLYAHRPMPQPWSPPDGVFEASVDPETGKVLDEDCRPTSGAAYPEFFLRRPRPPMVCPDRGQPILVASRGEERAPDDDEASDLTIILPRDLPGRSEAPPPPDLEEMERRIKRIEKAWKRGRIEWEDIEDVREVLRADRRGDRDDDDDDRRRKGRGKRRRGGDDDDDE